MYAVTFDLYVLEPNTGDTAFPSIYWNHFENIEKNMITNFMRLE